MKTFSLGVLIVLSSLTASAQSIIFADDALNRGYVERPYLRYEAQEGECVSEGVSYEKVSGWDYDQTGAASEASFGQCAVLTGKGSRVGWTLDKDANALTIRFSLPDSKEGNGTCQRLEIRNGDTKVSEIELDSYYAWQYTIKQNVSEKYPDNTPDASKFARMRFDEADILLPVTLKAGSVLTLVKENESEEALTIDFVEAELASPLSPEDFPGCVVYNPEDGSLPSFINSNAGKTLFLPAGVYDLNNYLEIQNENTHITGAGMWYTTLNFAANPDGKNTYMRRGVRCSKDNCVLENLSITTRNNRRYYENNASKQMGKALSGSWGKNSTVRNVRAAHFECGAWIADYNGNPTDGLTVDGCRFRNNYADGINLCSGTRNSTVRNCSFRNNGDDDMASWSTGNETGNNVFDHCTAENNWRASSLGFFGGNNNRGTNIAIYDGMECGARVTADFSGTGFSKSGNILIQNTSIRRCGAFGGATGTNGDFWGNTNPGLRISAGYFYDVNNVKLEDVLIEECRGDGFQARSTSGKSVTNLEMHNVTVRKVYSNNPAFDFVVGLKGNGTGTDLTAEDCPDPWISVIPATFDFTYTSGIGDVQEITDTETEIFNLQGQRVSRISGPGLYIVKRGETITKQLQK